MVRPQGFSTLTLEQMADAPTHGLVFLFLEKLCLEPVNFRLKK